ncbi:Rap/ran-GAP [Nesidiocoris tenuis]|uniref:Rap/ran-GAP n=1 Tax=Nesidiocoris tenuis TaxID=355587 RepID=A0ABN7AFT7_9HEMI|nr:Rap/ran-GAP [Nesidiocoris tenuis]
MFSKKLHADIKKSTQKLQDPRKDSATRFKHLKIILDNVDSEESKTFFETNYHNIFFVFYETFITAETNLRQKELPFHLVHKAHREEFEAVLVVLDKLLVLLPELLSKRWQCHCLLRLISKLLHPGNSHKLRREAVRYFLLWYQILGENCPDEVHALFATLVPGFHSPFPDHPGIPTTILQSSSSFYHDVHHGSISSIEILPIYPPQSGDKQLEDPTKFFMDAILEFMVTQVSRIEWKDKQYKQHRCFTFLFDRFRQYYLPTIFPEFSSKTSLFKPHLEVPQIRPRNPNSAHDPLSNCKVALIKWVANFTHLTKAHPLPQLGRSVSVTPSESEGERSPGSELRRVSVSQPGVEPSANAPFAPPYDMHICEDPNLKAFQVVRDVLYCSRDNVNFIHEIYRQAFLLDFAFSAAIRRAISVYKDWIQMNVIELPPFMLEPSDLHRNSGPPSADSSIEGSEESRTRLRNDSYIGAISRENMLVRAGLQNVLQVFITDAANVFLLDVGVGSSVLLDEQVDICKRVLNIYRYMVMHTHMEAKTWEGLLAVLLHLTSHLLSPDPPKRREETLGGRLAPAIFQTLIVTWIKANLNVVISQELWDQFFMVLSSLTRWEELIKEWKKTLETLTRVLARHVYGLELNDLPLDRLSEQKTKRMKKGLVGMKSEKCEHEQQMASGSTSTNNPMDLISGMEKDTMTPFVLRRSASETNLVYSRKRFKRHTMNPADNSVISNELDLEDMSTENAANQHYPILLNRRWRSMDSIKSPNVSAFCDSECPTRSPSPAPSSGMESNSFKESPMQIDVLSSEGTSIEPSSDGKSVMGGGTVRGWLPDVASVLWVRMLGALGDVNRIQDPQLHADIFHFLIDLYEILVKIRLNQGIPDDSQATPPPPELVPPSTIFSPWCFQAFQLPDSHHKGKLFAYKLLCSMTVMVHDVPLHPKHLSLFYSALHKGLLSDDQSIVNAIIKNCGPRFFSLQLPGYTLLLMDFIQAIDSIVSSQDVKNTPRTEAIAILGTILSFPRHLLSLPVLEPIPDEMVSTYVPNIRDLALQIILKAGKTEIAGVARCIALSDLGLFLYQELSKNSKHPKIKEAINTLLLALRFNHKTVAQSASDILLLLCDCSGALLKSYPEIPPRIVEVLVGTLSHLMPVGDSDKRLLTSLVFCLGEWTMNLPVSRLIEPHNGTCLLNNIFRVLEDLSEGGKGRGVQVGSFHPDLVQEFNPNVLLDDLKQQDLPQARRLQFPASPAAPAHLISPAHSIQLAAKLVITHLVDNLGHFPLTNGGANLGSLVVEQDDVSGLVADQLSSQLFSAPNIQVLVSSLLQVLSLVEIPALDIPGTGVESNELVSAPSQVRIISRDLAGKSCWDASVLHGSRKQCYEREPVLPMVELEATAMNSLMSSLCVSALPQHTLRHRAPNVLPTYSNSADDMDNLDDLLQYIGHSSPELLESLDMPRNAPASSLNAELEQEAMGSILSMRILNQDYISHTNHPLLEPFEHSEQSLGSLLDEFAPFQHCRLLLSQLGMLGWNLRSRLHLVDKNDKFLRELRNLDSQRCRQTHKIAVIYVAQGQEDKTSILSNSGGSQAYEEFIAGLAWEVELETHVGFMGGLQRNRMTGVTAPYYSTSFSEVIFHVSTRMPSSSPEALLQKTRHLGNDEVHIVWSEHTRDYRRGIIPTDFCDVLIVIYPLPHRLYRIQVSRKPDVPYFGPLYNEAVVGHRELPGLVRATALSASRAMRSMLPFHQQYYEERGRCIETVIKNYKRPSTFEEFASHVFAPVHSTQFQTTSYQKLPGSSQYGNTDDGCASSTGSTSSNNVLLALLDTTSQKFQIPHSGEESGSWTGGDDLQLSSHSSVSPRPAKKTTSKTIHKQKTLLTPPESPTSRRSK